MPVIDVKLLTGRTPAVRAELIRAVPRESIRVLLHEVPPENWGVGGVAKESK